MTTNFLNVSVKMWSVLCFYMIHKTLSLSPTRYKRGHWQTIVKRWRKQGKHSQFDLLFCGYILLYYWKLHFFEVPFYGEKCMRQNADEQLLKRPHFNIRLVSLLMSFMTHMMLPYSTASRKHKLFCFQCSFDQRNMILKVIWMCFQYRSLIIFRREHQLWRQLSR